MLKKKESLKETKKILVNAEPEKCFWACDGQIFKNVKELAEGLKKMNDEVFKHHVTKEKNDFAKWVKDVFKEEKLALDLSSAKTAKAAAKKIEVKIG